MSRAFVDEDLPALNAWLVARGELALPRDVLPRIGLIEPDVAALFLLRTDTVTAFVHQCVTNPAAPLRARHRAVHAMGEALVVVARDLGFRHLVTWTSLPGAVRRAVKHAGTVVERNVTILARDI